MINFVALILLLWIFFLVVGGKHTSALMMVVFLVPVHIIPFSKTELLLNIGAYAVWAFWFAAKFNGEWKERTRTSLVSVRPLHALIWIGIIAGIIFSGQIHRADTFTKASPERQIINVTFFVMTALVLVRILTAYAATPEVRYRLMAAFSASSILHLFTNLASLGFFQYLVPDFLVSRPTITYERTFNLIIPRYAARLGSYEFVADFVLIVFAFSLINLSRGRHRTISMVSLGASLIIGLMSGTRSLFIIIAIFIVMVMWYHRRRFASVLKYLVVAAVGVAALSPFIISYFRNTPLFARIMDTIYKYQTQGLVGASNRNFEAGYLSLVDYGNVVGLGAYFLNTLGPSEIVSHNVLFAMYGKYGLFGIAFMLALFYKAYSAAKKVRDAAQDRLAVAEAVFYLGLLFALFAQEMKYSFIRDSSSILVYTVMFMMVFLFARGDHAALMERRTA